MAKAKTQGTSASTTFAEHTVEINKMNHAILENFYHFAYSPINGKKVYAFGRYSYGPVFKFVVYCSAW